MYGGQTHWKDVINLVAAVQAQEPVFVTYNMRGYQRQQNIIRVMTPGELVAVSREAIYRKMGTRGG